MKHIVSSAKSVDQAASDLEQAVTANQFGVLHIHDLKATMKAKRVDFPHECRIFEVCNPVQAKQVLEANMLISTALPCRISVYEQGGKVSVSTLRPTAVLGLFGNPELEAVAKSVEEAMIHIIDAACE